MEAPEFFAKHHATGNISKELQHLEEEVQVRWESESVHPAHSPGPVRDAEALCRPHVNPTHYEAGRQQLKPTAFDDAITFGLSVDRLSIASLDAILAKAAQRLSGSNAATGRTRVLFGYSTFQTEELRKLHVQADGSKDPPRRGVGVYDTALEGEPEHADVCVIAPNSHGGRSVRLELFRLGNASHRLLAE